VAGADEPVEVEHDDPGDLPETGMVSASGFWRGDEEMAWRQARASGRGLFVSFYASWCEACVRLERDTLADSDVRAAIRERFVPLRLDVSEETRNSREQLERYGVYQLPAIVVVDAAGKPIDRIDSYLSREAMLSRLDNPDPAMAHR
jgi:thiol:disulfide interchange protein